MRISVVLAIYNGEKYIIEQLESIRKQTYQPDEVILIDDCSTDDSYRITHQFIDGYKLNNWKLIKNENNLGYRNNFKKGLALACGDLIFLADQDDRWYENKIETMTKYMNDDQILSLASSFCFMDQDGQQFTVPQQKGKANNNLLFQPVNSLLTKISLESLIKRNFAQGCTMCVKKEVVKEFLATTKGILPHDWELNILSSVNEGCYFLNIPLIDYRIHDNNVIGLDKVVHRDLVNEKTNRVKNRIALIQEEKEHLQYALSLSLSNSQREQCLGHKKYIEQRLYFMKEKKIGSVIMFFLKGKYKGYGSVKTFIGDFLSIINLH